MRSAEGKFQTLARLLAARGIATVTDVKTADLCTFRIGGKAPLVIEPQTVAELTDAVRLCRMVGMPFLPIGCGSNLLFPDGTLRYALLRTVRMRTVERTETGLIAACGVPLARLAALCAQYGFEDLLFLCGIPGTLGGGVWMNAGAHGGEIGNSVSAVRFLPLPTLINRTYFNDKLTFSYRKSNFQSENSIILEATLSLHHPCETAAAREKIRALLATRRAAQPVEQPSAGSAFCRPSPDVPMGKLLDELGLKGLSVGGAQISEKHAGFIVNRGDARAADVRALVERIQLIVEREKGFCPRPEIRILSEEL